MKQREFIQRVSLDMRSRCGIAKTQVDRFDGTHVMDGWALLVCLACPHLEIREKLV